MRNDMDRIRSGMVRLLVIVVVLAGAALLAGRREVQAQNEQPCYDQYQQLCTATPQGPPPPQATRRPTRTPTASATLQPSPRPSDTPTRVPTTTPTPTATVTPAPTTPPSGPIRRFTTSIIDTIIGWVRIPPDRVPPFIPHSTRTPTPRPTLNLVVTDIETTQAIQCMGRRGCPQDSVPLYTGKATLVRVYVRISSGPSLIGGIGGALCPGDTGEAGCSDPIRPTGKITVTSVSDPAAIVRGDLNATLNFILPSDWVASAGKRTFTVYANYNMENAPEWNYSDNYGLAGAYISPSQSLDITFLPMSNKSKMPSIDERWALVDWLKRVYPTSAIHVWERKAPLFFTLEFNLDDKSGPGCGGGWNGLLSYLRWLRGDNPRHYYGMVDMSTLGGYGGCGYTPGVAAGGGVLAGDVRGPEIAAQEIGHNLDRRHAPGCGAGGPDGGYPEDPGNIDEFGVDVGRMRLYLPSKAFDFMGYCGGGGNKWVSVYTYEALSGKLPSGVYLPGRSPVLAMPLAADAQPEFLVASGSLSPGAATIDYGFYRMPMTATSHDALGEGPYTVELRDAAGRTLFTRSIAPDVLSNAEAGEEGPFFLILPWKDKAASVVFLYKGRVIGRRVATRNAPAVEITQPQLAEDWSAGGVHTVAWQASDADGDRLTYILQYSADGGHTWETIAPFLTTTEAQLDASGLAGAASAQFRVFATDGFNTGVAVTGGPITVSDKSPQVHIDLPLDGTVVDQGAQLVLEGSGTDMEDGPLAGAALAWSSDKDGALGSGDLFITRSLSVGDHVVTLTGVDAAGTKAAASVHVTVRAVASEGVPPAEAGGSGAPWLWILGGAVLLVLGGVLGAAVQRRKRA